VSALASGERGRGEPDLGEHLGEPLGDPRGEYLGEVEKPPAVSDAFFSKICPVGETFGLGLVLLEDGRADAETLVLDAPGRPVGNKTTQHLTNCVLQKTT